MAFIPVISLLEAKEFLTLPAPNIITPTSEDALVFSLCAAVTEEIRGGRMTNRPEDADFAEIANNPKVRHVALQMVQWYFAQTLRSNKERQGLVSVADTMNGASATTSYENSETMDKRWRRELQEFRIHPL